jgi:prepilin-type processing-associated H-X9-DG protein
MRATLGEDERLATPAEPSTSPLATTSAERPFQFRLVHLLVAVTMAGVVLALFVPAWRAAREAANRQSCSNNLKQLVIALHNYHDTYLCFPPARYDDANGKPMHSWRVLIHPFLVASPLYDQYSFAEPWNGPNNAKLLGQFNFPFTCHSNGKPGYTNYVAIVGPGTIWPDGKQTAISDILDGTSNTLMVVEIADSDILWMEPRDLPVEELAAWLDAKHKPQLLGNHIEGGLVAYADGHVELLPRDVTIERLKALTTVAGNDIKQGRPPPRD